MTFLKLTSLISFTILLTACGGGSSNSDGGTGSNNSSANTSGNSTGPFDLTQYLFHDNLDIVGGSHSYKTGLYKLDTGEELFGGVEITEEYFKQDENTVIQRFNSFTPATNTYVITETTIEETVHSSPDIKRTLARSVGIDEVYLDTTDDVDSSVICKVISHLPSFDLSNATGSFNLAAGVYNDVLKLNCVTSSDGALVADFDQYFAKDFGLLLTSGSLEGLGDVYLIPSF